MAPTMYEDIKEYLNWYDTRKDQVFQKDAPVIGLVLQRSHLVTGDEGHYAVRCGRAATCSLPCAEAAAPAQWQSFRVWAAAACGSNLATPGHWPPVRLAQTLRGLSPSSSCLALASRRTALTPLAPPPPPLPRAL